MEQQFIAITEKAPKLSMLEEGLAREFLADYDSYENRVEDLNNVVPMRRCLEKADILELFNTTTEGIIQWQMLRAPGRPDKDSEADAPTSWMSLTPSQGRSRRLLRVALRRPWQQKKDLRGMKKILG